MRRRGGMEHGSTDIMPHDPFGGFGITSTRGSGDVFAVMDRHMGKMQEQMSEMMAETEMAMTNMMAGMMGGGVGMGALGRHRGGSGRQQTGLAVMQDDFFGAAPPLGGNAPFAPRGTSFHRTRIYSSVNAGGTPRTEEYEETSVAQHGRGTTVRETTQKYADSGTGVRRMGLERAIGPRARKIVRERRRTGDEVTTDLLKGIDDHEKEAFDAEWEHITGSSAARIGDVHGIRQVAGPTPSRHNQSQRHTRRSRPSGSSPGRGSRQHQHYGGHNDTRALALVGSGTGGGNRRTRRSTHL